MNRFDERTVIITGASGGIGAATARRLHHEGANLVLASRNHTGLQALAENLDTTRTLLVPGDLSNPKTCAKLIAQGHEAFGQIHGLVNNAGVAWEGSILDESFWGDWREAFAINTEAVIHLCRAALPHLRETRGAIVNVSSVAGIGGDWGMSIYSATKGAVSNFTRALALDEGSHGVRVNAVCPTYVRTELTRYITDSPALVERFTERIPLRRAGEPKEVANAIAFLASDDARFITGVNLPVDGGLTASSGQPVFTSTSVSG
ncbi:MAG: SDR family oxidoreductase [Kocuria sp.]|nr:SDR family oxidoreductase [Kocuria sp.]